MHPLVRTVQWLNHVSPWNQPKSSLAKRVEGLARRGGLGVYDGIAGGLKMRLDPTNEFERGILLNATNSRLIQLYRALLRPGDVYVDAGANIGLLTLVAARAVGPSGKAYAFECGKALERLRDNVALNAFDHVWVVGKGCWDSATTLTMYDFGEHDLMSLGVRTDKQVAGQTTIETVRVDDVVAEPSVRLMKIDVEGAELATVRGAERVLFSNPAPHVVLECNVKTSKPFGYHPMELVDHLLSRRPGDRLHLIRTKRLYPITRDALAKLLDEQPTKHQNVWFESGS